jgi:hypothetical protein
MSITKMKLPERLILEYVRDHLPQCSIDIARSLVMSEVSVKRIVKSLIKNGYLTTRNEIGKGEADVLLIWTGQPFPASSDYEVSDRSTAGRYKDGRLLAAKERRDAIDEVSKAIHSMVSSGKSGDLDS